MKTLFRPMLIPLALFLALAACSSCATSNSALKNHSHAAETLDDLAGGAKETVLELRQAKLDAAIESSRADELSPADTAARVTQAAADFDAGPAIGAVNAFIAAKDLYVRAVLASAAQDKPDWSIIKPMLTDVVKAYNAMRDALGNPSSMPAIPSAIANLLSFVEPPGDTPGDLIAEIHGIFLDSQPEVV